MLRVSNFFSWDTSSGKVAEKKEHKKMELVISEELGDSENCNYHDIK